MDNLTGNNLLSTQEQQQQQQQIQQQQQMQNKKLTELMNAFTKINLIIILIILK